MASAVSSGVDAEASTVVKTDGVVPSQLDSDIAHIFRCCWHVLPSPCAFFAGTVSGRTPGCAPVHLCQPNVPRSYDDILHPSFDMLVQNSDVGADSTVDLALCEAALKEAAVSTFET